MPTPPPPPKKDARRYARYEIFATVELRHGEETLVLPARNISLGGVYLAADGNKVDHIEQGETVEVMLFDALDEGKTAMRAMAQVVRTEADGIALTWASTDPIVARTLASLLERLGVGS